MHTLRALVSTLGLVGITGMAGTANLAHAAPSGLTIIPETRDSACVDHLGSKQPLSEAGRVSLWLRDCTIRENPGLLPATYRKLPTNIWIRDFSCSDSAERNLLGTSSQDLSQASAAISADGKWATWRILSERVIDPVAGTKTWEAHLFMGEIAEDLCENTSKNLPAIKSSSIRRIDRGLGGKDVTGTAYSPYISQDGRYVVFTSDAGNLDVTGAKAEEDSYTRVYLYDRTLNQLFSITPEANAPSYQPSVSDDGKLVVFTSLADNLVTKDENHRPDVFLYDRTSKTSKRLNINNQVTPPQETDRAAAQAQISGNGQFVVYVSHAINLIKPMIPRADIELEPSPDEQQNVFLYHVATGKNYPVSSPEKEACKDAWTPIDNTSGSTGKPYEICLTPIPKGDSWNPAISRNGRYISFMSDETLLIPEWTKENEGQPKKDTLFVRDLETGKFSVASVRYLHDGKAFQWDALKSLTGGQVSPDGATVILEADTAGQCTEELVLNTLSPWRHLCQGKASGVRSKTAPKP